MTLCFRPMSDTEPEEVKSLFRTPKKEENLPDAVLGNEAQENSGSKSSSTIRTKNAFICLTVSVVVLFVLSNLALTVWLIIGEFLCHKPSINGVQLNSTSTDDICFDRLSDILLIPVGFFHVPEHLYLLVYLYKFLQSYYRWESLCVPKRGDRTSTC